MTSYMWAAFHLLSGLLPQGLGPQRVFSSENLHFIKLLTGTCAPACGRAEKCIFSEHSITFMSLFQGL